MYKILLPNDQVAKFRGGGRYLQALKENLGDKFAFIKNLNEVTPDDSLIIPDYLFFEKALVTKRYCKNQIVVIPDAIPLKYASNFPVGLRGRYQLWRNKIDLKYFDKITCVSNHAKKDIINYLHIPEDKITVIYSKLVKMFYSEKSPNVEKQAEKYCIYVGDVNWNKNLLNLVKAIKLTDVKLYLVGKPFTHDCDISSLKHPWLAEYKQVMEIVLHDDQFNLLGFQSDDELLNLYRNAYLNVLLSRDEGFGYSYMEAASQSCPSLLNDTEVFHETSKEAAFFTNGENIDEIAESIRQIFGSKQLRDNMADQAKNQFTTFSKIDLNQEFLNLVEK